MSHDGDASLAAGDVLAGRFRIDRLLGRGGMGEVYAATNLGTGRGVALKIIRGVASKEQTRRFLREAKAATAIQHPHVIEVLDVFATEDDTPVMVMELLRGETLAELYERRGALELHELAALLAPIADAVRAAHAKGIVHRDLKPDNVFIASTDAGPVPKVLDFGIAKVNDAAALGTETGGAHTSTGSVLGTPHYMAYEQAMAEKLVDQRADVWAMGVMLFEGLTGRRPLAFENLGEMYAAFIQNEVPAVRAAVPDLPAEAADLIDRALHKRRDGRLGDLTPLVRMLEKYRDERVPGAHAGGKVIERLPAAGAISDRGRRRRIALALVTAATLVGALGVSRALRPRGAARGEAADATPEPRSEPSAPSTSPSSTGPPPLEPPATAATPTSADVSTASARALPPPGRSTAKSAPKREPASAPTPAPAAVPTKTIADKLPY